MLGATDMAVVNQTDTYNAHASGYNHSYDNAQMCSARRAAAHATKSRPTGHPTFVGHASHCASTTNAPHFCNAHARIITDRPMLSCRYAHKPMLRHNLPTTVVPQCSCIQRKRTLLLSICPKTHTMLHNMANNLRLQNHHKC